MDYNLEDLLWKCQECDASAPPTTHDYMKLLRHQKGHHIRLIDTKTGTILATSIVDAQYKGIELPGKPSGESLGKAGGPSGKPPQKPGEIADRGMEISEEGITFLITLPPIAFTLFDAAKAAKLVDEDKDIDYWVFECIQKRFELDYELRLMLVDIKAVK